MHGVAYAQVDKARQVCPDLVLVSGEDLMPYRQASRCVFGILQRFGTAQKAGLDEVTRATLRCLLSICRRAAKRPREASCPHCACCSTSSQRIGLAYTRQ